MAFIFNAPRRVCFISVALNLASAYAYTNSMPFSNRNLQLHHRANAIHIPQRKDWPGWTLFAQEKDKNSSSKRESSRMLLLSRPHERGIFAFYAIAGTAVSMFTKKQGLFQVGLATMWASFVLAISFMEAWVKFQAPFLSKHVAVDVGRHVFAALQAAELGMCTALWFSCSRHLASGMSVWKSRFSALSIATGILFGEALFVAPRLYLRAKARIVEGFKDLPPDVKNQLLSREQDKELDKLSREVDERKDSMPSKRWHSVYGLLELFKVIALATFVVVSWFELFCDVLVHYTPRGW